MSKMKKLGMSLLFVLLFVLPVNADTICNHQWSEWEITEEPDCESTGSKERCCELCGESEEQEIAVDSGAHDFSEWYVEKRHNNYYALYEVRCESEL